MTDNRKESEQLDVVLGRFSSGFIDELTENQNSRPSDYVFNKMRKRRQKAIEQRYHRNMPPNAVMPTSEDNDE